MTMGLSIQLCWIRWQKNLGATEGTTIPARLADREVDVGVIRKTLPMMKFPNGVYCLFQSLRPMLLIVTGWRTMLNIKGGNVCV